jgi:Protein of unknown function (DUF2867)
MAARAHRVDVTEKTTVPEAPDFASAFEVAISQANDRSPEDWARTIFEQGPPALRSFVLIGWRFVLGLHLAPGGTPDQIAGWRVVDRQLDAITLEARSRLMTARKVVRIKSSQLLVTTFVQYDRPAARVLWPMVVPIHHRTEPLLLAHAVSERP